MVVTPSRCCSHCRLFCSSMSLRNISILVQLFQRKDGAVICVAGERREAGASPWPLGLMGPAVGWPSGGGGTLPSQHVKLFFNKIKELLVLRLLLPCITAVGTSPLSSMKRAGRGVGRSFQVCFFTTKTCAVCLFCEGILCGSSPEAMDIVSLISMRILQNLHLALGVPTAHASLSQHEPSQEFVISAYSCTMPKTISSYFGADPVC